MTPLIIIIFHLIRQNTIGKNSENAVGQTHQAQRAPTTVHNLKILTARVS